MEIRFCVSCTTQGNFAKSMFLHSVQTAEGLASAFTPLKLQGLSAELAQDPDISDLINEISLESLDYMYSRPEYRLLYKTGVSALAKHQQNRMMQSVEHHLLVPVGEEILNKYSSL